MTEPRTVQYWKWGRKLHWRHDMVLLGEDEHGVWLGAEAGAIAQRGTEPAVSLPVAFVQLVRPDSLWTAIFNAPGGKYEIYVDITTAAEWTDDRQVEFIDMDLDVVRRPNGEVEVIDQDEFAEHIELFDYPADLIDAVSAAAEEVRQLIVHGVEPFGTVSHRWLDQLETGRAAG